MSMMGLWQIQYRHCGTKGFLRHGNLAGKIRHHSNLPKVEGREWLVAGFWGCGHRRATLMTPKVVGELLAIRLGKQMAHQLAYQPGIV
jgi:hypothetical protein